MRHAGFPYAVARVVVAAAGVTLASTDAGPLVGGTCDRSIGLIVLVLADLAGASLGLRRFRATG